MKYNNSWVNEPFSGLVLALPVHWLEISLTCYMKYTGDNGSLEDVFSFFALCMFPYLLWLMFFYQHFFYAYIFLWLDALEDERAKLNIDWCLLFYMYLILF